MKPSAVLPSGDRGNFSIRSDIYKVVPPPVIRVIIPLTIDISPINHGYLLICTNLANYGAPPCRIPFPGRVPSLVHYTMLLLVAIRTPGFLKCEN